MQLYDPDRVKKPLKRTNPDRSPGADPRWQELSWAQALDEIAGELRTLRDAGEAHKLLWISEDHSFTHVQGDFCTLYGTPNYGMHSNLCDVARKASFASVVGHDRPLADFIQSRYILLFGWNPVSAIKWVHLPRIITRAVERGARLVVVDPYLSDTAAKAQEWVSIRPAPTAPSRSRSRTSSSAMASTTRTSSPAGPSASTSTPSWSRRRPPPGPSRSRRCAPP
jgi:thiosulfate reductase/polysulfide reductase chain A